MTMKKLQGSCLCGQVRFTVAEPFLYAGYCHCTMCRKASAAVGTAVAAVSPKQFQITAGAGGLKSYQRSEKTHSYFCGSCSSMVYGQKPETGVLHIRMGLLDDEPSEQPQAHIFVASKAGWYSIQDNLPQFEQAPVA
ncbi:GFA family protein [uncultured Pseudoteredinibacter sp.]|uniref:GFA family protein n=1 Tax=uncultured Pseudoteredinibacter sp. TaxID=1641701 RepID=UPI00261EE703|nr:GFA family protein [uncultured Pseudoteredinibacter sp.]